MRKLSTRPNEVLELASTPRSVMPLSRQFGGPLVTRSDETGVTVSPAAPKRPVTVRTGAQPRARIAGVLRWLL
jgi:hypothetical protein